MCQVNTGQDRSEAVTQTLERRRARVERVLELAQSLAPGDRLLLRQVFELGLKPAEIARQAGVHRGRIYRRVRTLLRRMKSPLFARVAMRPDSLPRAMREVARCVVLLGLGARETSTHIGLSHYEVRRHIIALEAIAGR